MPSTDFLIGSSSVEDITKVWTYFFNSSNIDGYSFILKNLNSRFSGTPTDVASAFYVLYNDSYFEVDQFGIWYYGYGGIVLSSIDDTVLTTKLFVYSNTCPLIACPDDSCTQISIDNTIASLTTTSTGYIKINVNWIDTVHLI